MFNEVIAVLCFAGFNVVTGLAAHTRLAKLKPRDAERAKVVQSARVTLLAGVGSSIIAGAFCALMSGVDVGDDAHAAAMIATGKVAMWAALGVAALATAYGHFTAWAITRTKG